MIGQTISHYRILEKLGGGGMGVVYKAHDVRLDRFVALKFLPADIPQDLRAVEQLRREARAASALNHPHICTIHDIDEYEGRPFIVMEMLEGQTLKHRIAGKPLEEQEIVNLGMQIADALGAAHARDIIHRDIKPANVFVTFLLQVKVLDFGLAKSLPADTASTLTASIAETRAFVGTLPYMAPEQLEGRGVSTRTDIYAIGTVLYEMATGQRPFIEEFAPELEQTILHKQPRKPRELNPAISPALEATILKCLEKEPEKRYHRTQQLLEDLKHLLPSAAAKPRRRLYVAASLIGLALATAVGIFAWRVELARRPSADLRTSIRSIAVLPLVNLSRDPEQEYFADGMTEELITDLAQISALKVISRTSAAQYKGTHKPLPQIGRELNVGALVEGSVQREENRVRITAQLIEAASDRHLWAKSYERDLGSILALQAEVARDIAGEIKLELTPQQQVRFSGARLTEPAAHDAYLKGRFFWNQRTPQGLEKAIEYFRQALERDPKYAPAYAGIADSYYLLPSVTGVDSRKVWPAAQEAAQKALELDDTLAEAHTSLAFIKCYQDWDWDGASREFLRAIELNPNYATAHMWYGRYLAAFGRHDEAIAEMKRAQEIDPFSWVISGNLATVYYLARRYGQAVEESRKAIELAPNHSEPHLVLASAYREQRNYREAIAEIKEAVKLSAGNRRALATSAYIYAVSGEKGEARKILAQLRSEAKEHYVSPFHLAMVYVGLSDNNHAFEMLGKAYEEHSEFLILVNVTPVFDSLHSDPRFKDLLHRMGLSQ